MHIDHPQEDVTKKRVVPPDWTSAVKESVREDVNNQKSVKAIGVTLGYHKNAEYQFLTSKPTPSYFLCSKSLSLSWKRKGKKIRERISIDSHALSLSLSLSLSRALWK